MIRLNLKGWDLKMIKELEFELQSNIAQRQDTEIYKSTLILKGKKPEEYIFEISLTGFFSIETTEELTDEIKNTLISKNTIAILMPYLRSEASILTAQPEVECVVLPPFNIIVCLIVSKKAFILNTS